MKHLLIPLLFLSLTLCYLSSCKNDRYTYKWKLAVVYTNGDKDTINCQYNNLKGYECYLTMKISGTEPCIILNCGFYHEPVACGIRKGEVLSFEKTPLK